VGALGGKGQRSGLGSLRWASGSGPANRPAEAKNFRVKESPNPTFGSKNLRDNDIPSHRAGRRAKEIHFGPAPPSRPARPARAARPGRASLGPGPGRDAGVADLLDSEGGGEEHSRGRDGAEEAGREAPGEAGRAAFGPQLARGVGGAAVAPAGRVEGVPLEGGFDHVGRVRDEPGRVGGLGMRVGGGRAWLYLCEGRSASV
jgi:hypothetical protein